MMLMGANNGGGNSALNNANMIRDASMLAAPNLTPLGQASALNPAGGGAFGFGVGAKTA